MIDEQDKNVDAETKNYLDTFQTNIDKQFNSLKDLFQSKLDPTIETTKDNSKEIKDHRNEITELRVGLKGLEGSVKILEDNKKSKQKQEALNPKHKSNLIAIISLSISTIVGFFLFLLSKMG